MLLINNELVKKPEDIRNLDKKTSNIIFSNLDKGQCLFVVPEDFNHLKISKIKNHKRNYKVGFLYDALTVVYPDLDKGDKHKIIQDKYHFWFSYRQFKTILDAYEKDKRSYLENRKDL